MAFKIGTPVDLSALILIDVYQSTAMSKLDNSISFTLFSRSSFSRPSCVPGSSVATLSAKCKGHSVTLVSWLDN